MNFLLQSLLSAATLLCPTHQCDGTVPLPLDVGASIPLVARRSSLVQAQGLPGDWGADVFVVQYDGRRLGIEVGLKRATLWMESAETSHSRLADYSWHIFGGLIQDGDVWIADMEGWPRRRWSAP